MADFTLEAGLQVVSGDISAAIQRVQAEFDKNKIRLSFDPSNVVDFIKQVQTTFDSNKIKLNLDTGDLKGGSIQNTIKSIDDLFARINKLSTTPTGGNDFAGTIKIYQKRIEEFGVAVGKAFGVSDSALRSFSNALSETIIGSKSLATFESYLKYISNASDDLKQHLVASLTVIQEKNISSIAVEFDKFKTSISGIGKELTVLSRGDTGLERRAEAIAKIKELYNVFNNKGLSDVFKDAIENGNISSLTSALKDTNFTIEQQEKLVLAATDAYKLYSESVAAAVDKSEKLAAKESERESKRASAEAAKAKAEAIKKEYDDIYSATQKISGLHLEIAKEKDKEVVAELRRQIDSISVSIGGIANKGLTDALNNAFKTGDVTAFEQALRATNLSAEDQAKIMEMLRDKISAVKVEDLKAVEAGKKRVDTFNSLSSSIKRFIGAFIGIQSVSQLLRSLYQNVVDLDKAIVDLQIATGYGRDVVANMVKDYSKLGQKLGVTTVDVTKAADSWLRQGYGAEEATKLITASTMLAKLGQIEMSSATDYLTSSMKGYGIAVEDVVSVVDKLSAVDLVSATSAGDLAEAMQKTAVTANQVGIPLERLIGMLATISEVSQQSASTVGTAMKSTLARMVNIKAGFLADPETGDDLSNVEAALRGVGIALRDDDGEFRNLNDVLGEIAKKWKTLSGIDRNAVAVALGGTRQQENVRILMEYWDQVVTLTNVAADSAGTAQKKFDAYSEGIEARLNALKSAWQSFSTDFLSSDFVKNTVSGLTKLLNILDKITNVLGGKTTFGLGAILFGTGKKFFSGVKDSLGKSGWGGALKGGLDSVGKQFNTIKSGAKTATTAITTFLSKILGVTISPKWLLAIIAAFSVIKKSIKDNREYWDNLESTIALNKNTLDGFTKDLNENETALKSFQETGKKDTLSDTIRNQIIQLQLERVEIRKNIAALEEQNKKLEDDARKKSDRQFESVMSKIYAFGEFSSGSIEDYAKYLEEESSKIESVITSPLALKSYRSESDGSTIFDILTNTAAPDLKNKKEVNTTLSLLSTVFPEITDEEIKDIVDGLSRGNNAWAEQKYGEYLASFFGMYLAYVDAIKTGKEGLIAELNDLYSNEYLSEDKKSRVKAILDALGLDDDTEAEITKRIDKRKKSYTWKKMFSSEVKTDKEIKQQDALSGVISVIQADARAGGIDDSMVKAINPKLAEHVAIIAKNDAALQEYIKDWQNGVITSEEFLEVLKNAQQYDLYSNGSTSWDRAMDELDSYGGKLTTLQKSRERMLLLEKRANDAEDDYYYTKEELGTDSDRLEAKADAAAESFYQAAKEAAAARKELALSDTSVKALIEKYPALTQDIIAYNTAIKDGSTFQAQYNKLMSDLKILADQNVASEINSQLSSFMGINDQGSFAAWMLNMENTLATTGKWNTDDITAFMQVFKDMQGDLSRTSKQDALTKLKDLAKERPDWEPWIKFFDTLFEFEKNHTQYETAFKAIQDFFNSSTPGEKQNAIEQLNDELEQLGVSQNVRKDIYDLLNVATTPAQKKNALQSMLDTLIALGDVNLSSLIEQTKELMKELDPAATERSAARNAQSALSSFMGAKNVADLEDAAIQMRKALWDSGNFETTNQRDLFFNLIFGDLLNNRDFSPENLFNLSKEAFSKMVADKRFSDWEPVFQEMFYSFDAQGNKRTAASNIVGALESYLGIESPDQRDQIARQIKDDLRTAFGEEKATQMMEDIFSPLLNADTFNMSDNGGIITQVLSAMFGTEDFSAFEYLAKDLYKTIADPTVWQNYTSPLETFFGADNSDDKAKAWGEFLDKLKMSGDVNDEVYQEISNLNTTLDRNSLIAMLIGLLQGEVNPNVIKALQQMQALGTEGIAEQMENLIRDQGGNVKDITNRQIYTFEDDQSLSPGDYATIGSMTFSSKEFGIEGPETWINVTPYFIGDDGQKRKFTEQEMYSYLQDLINRVGLNGLAAADNRGILLGMNNLSGSENSALMKWLSYASSIMQPNPNAGEQYAPMYAANKAANMGYGAKQFGSGFYGSEFGGAFEAFNTLQPGGMLTETQMQAMIAAMPQLTQEIVAFGQACANSSGDINAWNAAYAKMDEAIREQEGMQRLLDMKQALEDYKKASKDGTIHEQNDALQEMWDILQDMDVDMSKFYDTEGQEDYNKMLEQIKDNAWLIDEAFRNLQRDTFMDIAASYNVDTSQAEAALNAVMNGGLEVSNLSEEVLQKLIATGKFTTDKRELKGKFPYVESLWPFRVSTREFEGEQTILVPTDDNPYKGFKGSKHSGGGGKKGGGGKTSVISEQYTNDKGMYETLIDNLKNLNNLYEEGSEEWLRNQQRIIETYQAYAKTVQDEYDRLVKAGVSMTDKEMQTLAKDLIKVNKEIYDAAKEYWEAVRDNMKESMEHIVSQMDAVLDLRKAHKDLLTELRQENRELEKQYKIAQDEAAHPGLTEAEHEMLFSSEDYKRLTGMLQDISKQADALYEEYKNKIASVTEDETYAISYITDEYERQLGLLESQYEIAKQQLAVEKARQELQNTLRERNTAVLINGAWTWMADPDAVQAAMEKVADAEVELEDAITDSEFNKETAEIETARDAIKSSIDAMEALEFAIEDLAEGIVDLADSINENIFNAIGTTSRNYLKQTKGHGLELFMDELTELQETSGLVFSNTDVEKLYSLLSSGNTINSSNIFDDSIVHDSAAIASILSNTTNNTAGAQNVIYINGIQLSDTDSEMLLNALERVSYTWQA